MTCSSSSHSTWSSTLRVLGELGLLAGGEVEHGDPPVAAGPVPALLVRDLGLVRRQRRALGIACAASVTVARRQPPLGEVRLPTEGHGDVEAVVVRAKVTPQ